MTLVNGIFDFELLENFLLNNIKYFEAFRKRNITSFEIEDEDKITHLFNDLIVVLQIASGKSKGKKSPVCFVSAKFGPLMIFSKRWFAYNKITQGDMHEYKEETRA